MVTFDWEAVVAMAPELATVSDAAQAQVLAQVGDEVAAGPFGSQERADRVGLWLARHIGTMALPTWGGGSAPTSSVTVGSVSKSMSVAAADDWKSTLALTKYGREYQRLVRLYLGGPRVI